MKLGSLFDGSGGFPLAGALCGIEPIWASEIEPYPIAVTRTRFPFMKHLGDISKINGAEIEPVDIITFGSPCQDLSVAGKRAGLKHEDNGDDETTRSGLFMEAVRIIKEMREKTNGEYPRFAVWENVPGAFSSNKGEDFRIVLEELIKVVEPSAVMPAVPRFGWAYADSYCGDGWSLAYRVLDAQYWGVPQRRRRIYLVADFRGERAREILFEREGLRGYFTEGRTPWKTVTADAERSVRADDREGEVPYTLKIRSGCEGGGKGALIQEDKSATLACNNDQYLFQPVGADPYNGDLTGDKSATLGVNCGVSTGRNGVVTLEPGIAAREGGHIYEGVSGTLRANAGDNQMAVAYDIDHVPCVVVDSIGGQAEYAAESDVSPCLKATHYKMPPCIVQSAGFCPEQSAKTRGIGYEEENAPTLRAGVTPACVYSVENHPADSRVNIDDSGKVQCLTSRMGTGGGNVPMVMETVALEGNGQRPSHRGDGYAVTDKSYTLNSTEVHGVAYAIDQQGGKGGANYAENIMPTMCSDSHGTPHAVAYPTLASSKDSFFTRVIEDTANTLLATDYKDPQMVCYAVDQGGGKSQANVTEDLSPTLTCTHGGEPAIAIDRAFFNQGQNALYAPQTYEDGTVPTLVAKGPGAVAIRYIVRRLTPTESARLQGFADRWGDIELKTEFSDEDYMFWLEVRNTHAAIYGKQVKDYNKKQMLAWYNKLPTDSAEYKLWGNGIAFPTALYVIQGIMEAKK